MKIGIMGGTFDPIHNGHLMLGECAYRNFQLDQVWFMPNGRPPHKASQVIGSSIRHRLNMVSLAICSRPYFYLQPYEAERDAVSYSYETMEHFKNNNPDDNFYFIIGADSLFTIEEWVHPERLLQTCTILAACREVVATLNNTKEMISFLKNKYNASIELLEAPLLSISSKEIRKQINSGGKCLEELLPVEIIHYISENNLYENINITCK